MSLLVLQRQFRTWLQVGNADLLERLGPGSEPGLRVYQNNYRSQLVTCLEHSFPRTLEWLGAEAFAMAASLHVDRVAPKSWTIDAYAEDFPETLARLYPSDNEVAELAWLEWALGEALVSRDEASLGPEELRDVDWDRAVLKLSASLVLREARTNAGAIWSALASETMPPPADSLSSSAGYLVWRNVFQPSFRTIDALELASIKCLQGDASFAELCDILVEAKGKTAGIATAGELLGRWIAGGLIVCVVER